MDTNKKPLHRAETSAVLYLVAPLFIFFACFVRLEIAVPACAVIVFLVYELLRRTAWRESLVLRWEHFYFLFLAALWVWLSGGIGPLHQNNDWHKHYVIINFLTQHSWPAQEELQHFGNSALRYYIGWYLVPSLVLKMTNAHWQIFAMSAWSILGVFLFFNLLPTLVGKRWAAIAAPIVFIVFSGADIVGAILTHFQPPAPYYFEWWAGWVQFSSNTTAMLWVPQHAIPAWLGVAILMRFRHREEFLPYCALLASAILLWSPFSAMGLAPFLLALAVQHGFRRLVLDWRPVVSVLLLAVPVGLYLVAGSGTIPHGYIATISCSGDGAACFTWPSYFGFLLIEISAPLAILFLRREPEQGFLVAAAIALCLMPLYKVGAVNDFPMRASLPALAVLSVLCAKLLVTGPKPYSVAILVMLLAGLPTALGEMSRGFLPRDDIPHDSTIDAETFGESSRVWYEQYFAPLPIWVLRH